MAQVTSQVLTNNCRSEGVGQPPPRLIVVPLANTVNQPVSPDYEVIIQTATCRSRLWPNFLPDHYEALIKEITSWQQDTFRKRPVYRYRTAQGDPGLSYRYSGQTLQAHSWSPIVWQIKQQVERVTDSQYNFALCNYYPDGVSFLSWHSDDERDIVRGAMIASISYGERRDFQIRQKSTQQTTTVSLGPGDLLTMEGNFQAEYQHCVPKRLRVSGGRLNITFRLIQSA